MSNTQLLSPFLTALSIRQLRQIARDAHLKGYSHLSKQQLIDAIRVAQPHDLQFFQGDTTRSSNVPAGKTGKAHLPHSELTSELFPQEAIAATKFDVGGEDPIDNSLPAIDRELIDRELGQLPGGYGDSRIVLLPRDPDWAYAYWDIPIEHKETLRREGGHQLALCLYNVSDAGFGAQACCLLQEYPCDELAREWYLPLPAGDARRTPSGNRTYRVEIGYRSCDGRWLLLARSNAVTMPTARPSDWFEDRFITLPFDRPLPQGTIYRLHEPQAAPSPRAETRPGTRALRGEPYPGSGHLFGSVHLVPEAVVSSSPWPETEFPAPASPRYSRPLRLVADAELVLYGATEPGAAVNVNGRPIPVCDDGTFRLQMAFPSGAVNCCIEAVSADGSDRHYLHLQFLRQTETRSQC
jgi:hypothetical protein